MRRLNLLRIASRGFTLVEVLVGLVLGMIGIIIMFQVFQVFEGQRRTTVSGGNAQTSGHLAMYGIEREVRLAGLGMYYGSFDGTAYATYLTCPAGIQTYSGSSGGIGWASGAGMPVVPAQIAEGGANSDSLTATYGPAALGGTPAILTSPITTSLAGGIVVTNAPFVNSTSTPPVNAVFKRGDIILIAQPGFNRKCVRLKVTCISAGTTCDQPGHANMPSLRLFVDAGPGHDENPPDSLLATFLPSGGYTAEPMTGFPTVVLPMGGTGSPARNTYCVNAQQQLIVGGALPGCTGGTPVADGVISLQAQYGIGAASGPAGSCTAQPGQPACWTVESWTDAVAVGSINWGNLTTLADVPNINRIKAVRVAIFLRSQNLERDALYGAGLAIPPKATCTTAGDYVEVGGQPRLCAWRDATAATPPAVPLVNPSTVADEAACATAAGVPCWSRYRYRVYETVIPLRNVIWGTRGV